MTIIYWILCVVIGLIPAYFVYRKDRLRTFPVKWLPAFFRFLTFSLTAALLLAPAFSHHRTVEEKPVVLWLQDASSSMNNALKRDSSLFRSKAEKIWQDKNQKFDIIPLGFGTNLLQKINFHYRQSGTDISAAIENALRRYQSRNVAAVILASDGNYNMGSNPIYSLTDKNLPVYTIGLGDSTQPRDLAISFVRANRTATLGNSFELLVNIQARKLAGQSGVLKIVHQNKTIKQQSFSIDKNYYDGSFQFYLPANQKGLQQYTVFVSSLKGEQNTNNNQQDVFVDVLEKKFSVLIASSAPHPDIAAIREALRQNVEYKIQVKFGNAIPATVSGYDLLITHDLPDNRGNRIPKHGNIPTWNIIGPQTNLQEFSKEQDLLQISSGGGFQNAIPALNPSFGLFALPENIREVTAAMPPLQSPVGSYQLSGGQVLFWQQNSHGREVPLWLMKSGDHPQSILCGTGIWRWRLYAYKNFQHAATVDELIRQTVIALTHQNNKNQFQVNPTKFQFQDREPIQFNATLQDATGNLTNVPEAKLVLKDSSGKVTTYDFDKSGKSYRLTLGMLPAGNYTYQGVTEFNDKRLSDDGAFKVNTVSLEQLKSYSNFKVLYNLAHITGGHFFTLQNMNDVVKYLDSDKNLKPILRQETHYYHWIDLKWLFFLILLSGTVEWLLRKYWGI